MPSAWTTGADRDLLLSIITEVKLQALDWAAITGKMAEKGHTFTQSAARYVPASPLTSAALY